MAQTLDGWPFDWDPTEQDIPQQVKTVVRVWNLSGSAVYHWNPLWVGARVEFNWEWMPRAMYVRLRQAYLEGITIPWVPGDGRTYQVFVLSLEAKYLPTALDDMPYRKEVKMVVDIRSVS